MTTNHWDLPEEFSPWTLAEIYADLASRDDICAALGVGRPRFRGWNVRKEQIKTPRPIRTLGGVHIYSLEEWRVWFDDWTDPQIHGAAHARWDPSLTAERLTPVQASRPSARQSVFTDNLTCPTCQRKYEF